MTEEKAKGQTKETKSQSKETEERSREVSKEFGSKTSETTGRNYRSGYGDCSWSHWPGYGGSGQFHV